MGDYKCTKCQLSVKILPICQLNFKLFVSCQFNDY